MIFLVAAAIGLIAGLFAHNLAAQSLGEKELRPWLTTCSRCYANNKVTRQRCQECGRSRIRPFALAATTSAVAVGFAATLGVSVALVPFAGFLTLTAALMITDIDSMRIVDRLNLRGSPALIVALGVSSLIDGTVASFGRGLLGGLAYFGGAFALFAIVRGRGFGAGDVKLAPLLGVFTGYLGWEVLGRGVFTTALIGGLGAVVALIFFRATKETELPYGPAMILGSWIAVILAGMGSSVIPS